MTQVLDPVGKPSGAGAPARGRLGDGARSVLATGIVVSIGLAFSEPLFHWFLLPIAACGCLAGVDASRWLRRELDLLSPQGLVGVFGFHFFLVAPMLNVAWDEWPRYVPRSGDYRPWLGLFGMLNLAGLVMYRLLLARFTRRDSSVPQEQVKRSATVWLPVSGRTTHALLAAFGIAALLQVVILGSVGGFGGYVSVVEGESGALQGLGWVLTVAESAPTLALAAWAIALRGRRPSRPLLVGVVLSFLASQFIFAGLRGARGNLIYGAIVMIGIVHYWVRPVTRRAIALGAVAGLLFMYGYGLYKSAGSEGFRALTSLERSSDLADATGRTVPAILVGDLGRADIQAILLKNRYDTDFPGPPLANGRTYLGGVAGLVPFLPDAIGSDSRVFGAEALYGKGAAKIYRASNIYGLGGETLLNWGPWLVPFAFIALGFAVRRAESLARSLHPSDVRRPLIAVLAIMCILLMSSDLGNVLYAGVQYGLVLLVALSVGTRHVRRGPTTGYEVEAAAPAVGTD